MFDDPINQASEKFIVSFVYLRWFLCLPVLDEGGEHQQIYFVAWAWNIFDVIDHELEIRREGFVKIDFLGGIQRSA